MMLQRGDLCQELWAARTHVSTCVKIEPLFVHRRSIRRSGTTSIHNDHVICRLLYQIDVVSDKDHATLEVLEGIGQSLDRVDVEVVRGLFPTPSGGVARLYFSVARPLRTSLQTQRACAGHRKAQPSAVASSCPRHQKRSIARKAHTPAP